jgi:hypothetical protein
MPSTPRSSRNRVPFGGRDVARDQLNAVEPFPERLNRARHHDGVAVCDVDDDDVDARANQLGGPFQVIALGADGRTDAKPSLVVPSGKRQLALMNDVLRRNQSKERVVLVDERQLLDLLRPHDVFGRGEIRRAALDDQPLARRHPACDGPLRAIDEPQIARRQQPLQPATVVDNDERSDAGRAHPRRGVSKARVGGNRIRIVDDAVLLAFDDLDFPHLRVDFSAAEATIDDADAAFFGDRDRHLRSRYGVHVRRDDRPLERDTGREAARQIDGGRIAALDDAVLRVEQEVVERGAADEVNEGWHRQDLRIYEFPDLRIQFGNPHQTIR